MIQSLILFLKGMAMGAADVVPGVSGGTIALITGIYDRLIDAIKSVGLDTLSTLRKQGIAAAWKQIDGTFLVALLTGILCSVLLLARVLHHLMENEPVLIWSFFFGLIIASAIYVGRQLDKWTTARGALLLLGAVFAAFISKMTPGTMEVTTFTLFVSGAIAICAMILPGISGGFLLLLMGMYAPVIAIVKGFQIIPLMVFAGGCLTGILLFSRLLSWLLHHFHSAMLALLTGFMLGALVKIWPWKEVISYTVKDSGKKVPLVEQLVWPFEYAQDPQLLLAIGCMLIGAGMVFLFDKLGNLARESEK